MKKIFSILALCFIASQSFAQGLKIKKGFYLNPNFNHTSSRFDFNHHGRTYGSSPLFEPNLTLGYLWGNKNRHNIALTTLKGIYSEDFRNAKVVVQYSYDILAFRKNKFSFFISPYLAAGVNHYNSVLGTGYWSGRVTDNYASLSAGVAPVFEYKLGKRVDFVASLPLEIYKQQYANVTTLMNNQPKKLEHNSGYFLSQGQAKIGIRLNLFRK